MKPKTISGAEFKQRFSALLASMDDKDQLFFGAGDLSFYRFKDRGPVDGHRLINIEFNEVYAVTVDPDAV